MSLVKWDPWREMENMFDRYTRATGLPGGGGHEVVTRGDWSPRVDISETDEEFIIKAEIPEVSKEDVSVTADKGILRIQGERKQEKEEENRKFHRVERYYGTFTRSFTLPDNVDESKIDASFKDGMLTLQLPKTKESKTKAIQVKIK